MFYCKPYLPFSCCNLKDVCEERKTKDSEFIYEKVQVEILRYVFKESLTITLKKEKSSYVHKNLGKQTPLS
jgi:hypothetical protein